MVFYIRRASLCIHGSTCSALREYADSRSVINFEAGGREGSHERIESVRSANPESQAICAGIRIIYNTVR
jgi:hypothetical protein